MNWNPIELTNNATFVFLDLKPDFHLNACGRIDRFDRIGRKGGQFPLKRIDRFDRVDQTACNYSTKTNSKAVLKWA